MKTLTFYSYKGGVGRTLALTNMALRLTEYGKKVAILDFDLEAPGIPFKFSNYFPIPKFELGLVDYIYEFSEYKNLPNSIKPYSFELPARNPIQNAINIIPAGNLENKEYWRKLGRINWHGLFYSDKPYGVPFFLELKDKIKNEFKPDYLLVDSRTGITDISGITLRILADDVVILAANSEENLYGCKKIIKNLLNAEDALENKVPNIHFILTRLPFNNLPQERAKEYDLVGKIKADFENYLQSQNFDVNILHSDRRLEIKERVLIGDKLEENKISIENDYLNLFHKIFREYIKDNEIELFNKKREAEKLYLKSKAAVETTQIAMEFIEKAIELDSANHLYYNQKATLLVLEKKDKDALDFLEKSIELNPNDYESYDLKARILFNLKNYEDAISFFKLALNLSPDNEDLLFNLALTYEKTNNRKATFDTINLLLNINPNSFEALNSLANLYRMNGEPEKAYNYIAKALEIQNDYSVLYGTIAEIYADLGKIEEFYLNLTIALSKGIDPESLNSENDVYMKFKDESRFINLLNRYGMQIENGTISYIM